MNYITLNSNTRPVPGYSNSNYIMLQLGGSWNSNHYIIINRYNGEIVASGKRKHCVEVWNNAGTAGRYPMAWSV